MESKRLDRGRAEGHGLDAEAWVEALQPVPEEIGQVARIPARTAGADAEALPAAVHPQDREHEAPGAQPCSLQALAERRAQAVQGPHQILRRGDGLGESAAHLGPRRRRAGRKRFAFDAESLAHAVRTVATGGSYLSPRAAAHVIGRRRAPAEADGGPTPHQLTRREASVMQLMSRGLTNRAIADELSLSEKTIKNNVNRIYAKLGARDRGEAIATWLGTNRSHPG